MTKAETIVRLAAQSEITKAEAGRRLDDMAAVIKDAMGNGGEFELHGVGKFLVKSSPARMGTNPRTGQPAQIKAGKRIVFRPSKVLKDAVA